MEYEVQAGESLSTIARDVLGDQNQWQQIAALNALVAPYVIYTGQVLVLPDPGTIQYGPATAVTTPASSPALFSSELLKNPWLWGAIAAAGLWWWSSRD
ncbi:MAG TPA: LysM domain-containing protein [Acidiferrobacterales bacterium]|nr:LysM domain-containing protein [Acidiferrobacterales bacterium]